MMRVGIAGMVIQDRLIGRRRRVQAARLVVGDGGREGALRDAGFPLR